MKKLDTFNEASKRIPKYFIAGSIHNDYETGERSHISRIIFGNGWNSDKRCGELNIDKEKIQSFLNSCNINHIEFYSNEAVASVHDVFGPYLLNGMIHQREILILGSNTEYFNDLELVYYGLTADFDSMLHKLNLYNVFYAVP